MPTKQLLFNETIGWCCFLLLNIAGAALIVYLVEEHASFLWSLYWGAMLLFALYAAFLAGWLIVKKLRGRVNSPKVH